MRLQLPCCRRRIEAVDASVYTSLLGDAMRLPSNESQPLELSCGEYVAYVDELLQDIAQQVRALSPVLDYRCFVTACRFPKLTGDSILTGEIRESLIKTLCDEKSTARSFTEE